MTKLYSIVKNKKEKFRGNEKECIDFIQTSKNAFKIAAAQKRKIKGYSIEVVLSKTGFKEGDIIKINNVKCRVVSCKHYNNVVIVDYKNEMRVYDVKKEKLASNFDNNVKKEKFNGLKCVICGKKLTGRRTKTCAKQCSIENKRKRNSDAYYVK